MAQQYPIFWTCPDCVHARELNLEQMTNHCQLIDQGESPVDGKAWECHDHDLCPAFKPKAGQQALALIAEEHSTHSL
jgi:hypothetical protein